MAMARAPLAVDPSLGDLVATLRDADVPDETIHLAHECASWSPELARPERRALALLVVALEEARAEGSTRLPLGTALADRVAQLGVGAADTAAVARLAAALAAREAAALAPLVGAPGDYRPFIVDGEHLYAHRDLMLEERLSASLAARLGTPPAPADARGLERALAAAAPPGKSFTAEQETALRSALTQPLTVVTGGPGTGKTALVAGIVRALGALGLPADEIGLAAPTGKAANRIGESLAAALAGAEAPRPQTLHRLLGYHGDHLEPTASEFRHHENYPLPHRVVLVDETSMVDLALMERLARAVRPDARLVLLGDADQLPSVEAGAVFRDLGRFACVLRQSHRMSPDDPAGAAVLAAARAVRVGEVAGLRPAIDDPRALAFAGFEQLAPATSAAGTPGAERRLLGAFLDAWYETRIRALPRYDELGARVYTLRADGLDADDTAALGTLLDHHARLRVLSPMRGGASPLGLGADALNAALARRAAARAGAAGRVGDFPPGTPVLMTRNDYLRGLYNGDQGVVVRVVAARERLRLMAVFPQAGGLALFPLSGLRHDLSLAYASTVHKAQGAELEHAALVLPERDLPLVSRELLYTALTRARRSVVVVGRRELLARGAARPLQRSSGLAERLRVLSPRVGDRVG